MVANGRKVAKGDPVIRSDTACIFLEAAIGHALGPTLHRERMAAALFDVLGVVLIKRLGLDSRAGFDDAALAYPLADAVGFITIGSRCGRDYCRWSQAITLPSQGSDN